MESKVTAVLRVLIAQVMVVSFIGIFIAIIAHYFVAGIQYFEMFRGQQSYLLNFIGFQINLWTASLLLIAYLLVVAIRHFGQMSKWESPADIIYCAQNPQQGMTIKKNILTIVASFVSLSGGASLGQYGPLVHLGGALGIATAKWYEGFHLSRDVIIGCGVAAAIAAGFNAPIAAIIFAHEAVLRHFSARALALISISSVTASALNQFLFNPLDIFVLPADILVSPEMVVVSLLAGVGFGVSAILIIKLLFLVNKFASHSRSNFRKLALFGLFYLLMISQIMPDALGLGMGIVNDLFSNVEAAQTLIILLIIKLSAVILSATIGFSGGFVGPALFLGAVLGALMGHLAIAFGIMSLTTLLVVSGAAAVAGTVFGAPLAMVILVLELTHSYELSFSAMLSIVVSSLIFHLFYGHSLFDLQLLNRGIDLSKGRIFLELETIKTMELKGKSFLTFTPDTSTEILLEKMQKAQQTECYCQDEKGVFVGKISIFDLISEPTNRAGMIADQSCLKLYSNQSINEAITAISDFVGEGIPVVDFESHRLLKVVSEGEIFEIFNTINKKVEQIEKK